MPTSNPRMQITVKPETKKIFEDAAKVMNIPASRLVTQVLEESQESIMEIGLALKAAQRDPVKGLRKINELVQNSRLDAAHSQLDIEDQIVLQERKRASKGE